MWDEHLPPSTEPRLDKNLNVSTKSSANPYVLIWDTYGLDNPSSGVFRYALHLYRHLPQNFKPILVGTSRNCREFAKALGEPVAWQISYPSAWAAKLGWVRANFKALQKSPPLKEGTLLYHGLSNFNACPLQWSPTPYVAPRVRVRTLLTIHDLIPFKNPRYLLTPLGCQLQILLPLVLRRVDLILAISKGARQELLERWPHTAQKTVLSLHGFDAREPFRQCGDIALAIGRDEHYKRWGLLMDTWRSYAQKYKKRLLPLYFVTDPEGVARWQREARDLLDAGLLVLRAQLSSEQLEALWQRSQLLVHPSLYEGFGMPIAEALSRGVHVICTEHLGVAQSLRRGSLHELSSAAAPACWAETIGQLQEKPRGGSVEELPTWQDTAERLVSIYQALLAQEAP